MSRRTITSHSITHLQSTSQKVVRVFDTNVTVVNSESGTDNRLVGGKQKKSKNRFTDNTPTKKQKSRRETAHMNKTFLTLTR